jgi:hypothetical protein
MFSHCVGCQKGQQIFVPQYIFLSLERAKIRRGLSQVNKVDVHFCNGVLSHELLTHHAQGHCHGGESTYQARVWVFSSEQIPITSSALPNNTVDLLFILVQ